MKTTLWEIFEISVNFYQGFLLMYFVYAYLGDKKHLSFIKGHGALFGIILAVAISTMNHITFFEHFYAIFYTIIIYIYALLCCNGTFLKKILASVLPNLVMGLISTLVANIASILFNKELYIIYSQRSVERFVLVIIVQLLLLLSIQLLLKLLGYSSSSDESYAKPEWMLIISVFIISVIISILLNLNALTAPDRNSQIFNAIVFAGIILINIAVCYLTADLGKRNKVAAENEILRIKQQHSRQYIENAKLEYDAIRKLRHDYKNNISTVYMLLKEQNTEKAVELLEESLDIASKQEVYISTDNDVVNAVVNIQLSAANSFGIEVTCLSVKDFHGINDIDLCRLLSNMLENAITAVRNVTNENRQIYVKICRDEEQYDFCVKNTIDKSVLENNPALTSTKAGIHGYGKKIIKDIAKKYNGRCDFYEENGRFCCHVILKIE